MNQEYLEKYLSVKGNERRKLGINNSKYLNAELYILLRDSSVRDTAFKYFCVVPQDIASSVLFRLSRDCEAEEFDMIMKQLMKYPDMRKDETADRMISFLARLMKASDSRSLSILIDICSLVTENGSTIPKKCYLRKFFKEMISDGVFEKISPESIGPISISDSHNISTVMIMSCTDEKNEHIYCEVMEGVVDWLKAAFGVGIFSEQLRRIIIKEVTRYPKSVASRIMNKTGIELVDTAGLFSQTKESIKMNQSSDEGCAEETAQSASMSSQAQKDNKAGSALIPPFEKLMGSIELRFAELKKYVNNIRAQSNQEISILTLELSSSSKHNRELEQKVKCLERELDEAMSQNLQYQEDKEELISKYEDMEKQYQTKCIQLESMINTRSDHAVIQFRNRLSSKIKNDYRQFSEFRDQTFDNEFADVMCVKMGQLYDLLESEGIKLG